MRHEIILHLRDAAKMAVRTAAHGPGSTSALDDRLADLHRVSRRKLELHDLRDLADRSRSIQAEIAELMPVDTENMSGNDSQKERHIQNSKTYIQEPESAQNDTKPVAATTRKIPLALVLKATPKLAACSATRIETWRDFHTTANVLRPMLGLDDRTWAETLQTMTSDEASVAIACILQRIGSIRRPAGFLRALRKKAATEALSAHAMALALCDTLADWRVDSCQLLRPVRQLWVLFVPSRPARSGRSDANRLDFGRVQFAKRHIGQRDQPNVTTKIANPASH